jgi:hypothetical protein
LEEAEETEPEPPTPRRVAARALALAAVGARGLFEKDGLPEECEVDRNDILSWIDAIGIRDELEPDEWKILQRPIGSLDRQAWIDATWRIEGLAVLAWALQCAELPPYDQQVPPRDLFSAIGYWEENAGKKFLVSATLRPTEELQDFLTIALAVHWRLTQLSLDGKAMDFKRFSREGWMAPFDLEPFRLIEGDLALGDYPVSMAPKKVLDSAKGCALERHLAINWLMGYSRIYSETDTST